MTQWGQFMENTKSVNFLDVYKNFWTITFQAYEVLKKVWFLSWWNCSRQTRRLCESWPGEIISFIYKSIGLNTTIHKFYGYIVNIYSHLCQLLVST